MAMRLLKKSEVDKAKAEDRKREIDEGLKLATRVDSLRETQANEEKALERFRIETISRINEEIVSLTKTKNELSKEVSDLEDRKREALKPLDEAWEEVNLKQDELTEYAHQLHQDREIVSQAQRDHEVEVELLKVEKSRVSDERDRSIKSLADAEAFREESRLILFQNRTILEESKTILKESHRKAKLREQAIHNAELILKEREKTIQKKEKDIISQNIFLADQRKTLERAMARLKK